MAATQTEFKNTWQPPKTERIPNVNLDTEPEDYDFNFMFEPKVLTGHRVQLRPFVVSCAPSLLELTLSPNFTPSCCMRVRRRTLRS